MSGHYDDREVGRYRRSYQREDYGGSTLSFAQSETQGVKFDLTRCDRLIVTDGIRYALHRRSGEAFNLKAYLNILAMRV